MGLFAGSNSALCFLHRNASLSLFPRINLYELMKNNSFQGFSLSVVRCFTLSVLKCLQMLYVEKIIHCDLKPVSTTSVLLGELLPALRNCPFHPPVVTASWPGLQGGSSHRVCKSTEMQRRLRDGLGTVKRDVSSRQTGIGRSEGFPVEGVRVCRNVSFRELDLHSIKSSLSPLDSELILGDNKSLTISSTPNRCALPHALLVFCT